MRYPHKVFIICICIALVFSCSDHGDQPGTGDIAKDFRLNSLARERFYLNQHKGKVVVLVFWATWCVICKKELVELKSFSPMVKDEELIIAGICTDPENNDSLIEIVKTLGIDYPILLDKDGEVYSKYKVNALPTTIIIDRDSRVTLVKQGYNAAIQKQIKSKVESLLYR